MQKVIRIGTRDSQLAVWQATLVQNLLKEHGVPSELVYIKSEGDIDTVTPLYELGVQGVFTKTLDAALLNDRIDIAVHSMKDVPTLLAKGIRQASVLQRASHKDIFVFKNAAAIADWQLGNTSVTSPLGVPGIVATSSIRRIAQWRHRYPTHVFENLRGNVNTRLRKVQEHNWHGAIFAAAGLERIHVRPENSIDLDWMLPAPAQGAIMVVCREEDDYSFEACQPFNDPHTALCTKIERDFLRTLLGGCSTPISALAEVQQGEVLFKGNIVSPDGLKKVSLETTVSLDKAATFGLVAANEILGRGGSEVVASIRPKGTAL
ncbi:hydroxymethylbilane synthase [Paraflavisolibacter sp. H34]|uniref:hydroxymethylbilane synthase n=1 Tax=Huijunlia imazamoxiresistens TaxID=3127457 RepID=UPI003018544E